MDTVSEHQSSAEFAPADLGAARHRIAELEAELSQLRARQSLLAPTQFAQMRLSEVEAWLVKQAMDRTQGNISRAARILGLSRAALYRRLERHSLDRSLRTRFDRRNDVVMPEAN